MKTDLYTSLTCHFFSWCLSGLFIDYNVFHHVPSDIGIDKQYLLQESYPRQSTLNTVANWTQQNLMQMNEAKCNYMSFSRSLSKFATRLSINNVLLEKTSVTKLLGVWVSDDLSWSRNCREICTTAYSRLQMITKLKYVAVNIYIRSITEYCSVVFHSSLTTEQS